MYTKPGKEVATFLWDLEFKIPFDVRILYATGRVPNAITLDERFPLLVERYEAEWGTVNTINPERLNNDWIETGYRDGDDEENRYGRMYRKMELYIFFMLAYQDKNAQKVALINNQRQQWEQRFPTPQVYNW